VLMSSLSSCTNTLMKSPPIHFESCTPYRVPRPVRKKPMSDSEKIPEKEKVTFNLSKDLQGQLEEAWLKLRGDINGCRVTKTLIVENAIKMAINDYEHNGSDSQLSRVLSSEVRMTFRCSKALCDKLDRRRKLLPGRVPRNQFMVELLAKSLSDLMTDDENTDD